MSNLFYCTKCKIPLGTFPVANQVTCSKCGTVYGRRPASSSEATPPPFIPDDAINSDEVRPAPAITPVASIPPSTPPQIRTTTSVRRVPPRGFQPASSWFDIFDWKFEKYLTPWVIRATWIICLGLFGLWTSLIVISVAWDWVTLPVQESIEHTNGKSFGVDEFAEMTRPRSASRSGPRFVIPEWFSNRIVTTIAGLTAVFFAIVGILWIRVLLETSIVLFNMAANLASIDKHLERQNSSSP